MTGYLLVWLCPASSIFWKELEMVVIETMDELKDYVKKVTAEQRDPVPEPKEEVVLSDLSKGLLSIWDKADFGCQHPHMAQILHLLVKQATGEDIHFKECKVGGKEFFIKRYSAIVLESNVNSHNYGNKPFILCKNVSNGNEGSSHFRMFDGTGNCPGLNDNKWRFATDEEIDTFFTEADKKSMDVLKELLA